MASCPLCGTEMTLDTCPRCVGAGRERDARLPQPVPGLAGEALRPNEGPDPVPVETVEPDEHGYLPAAGIFVAQGVASLLAFGAGHALEIVSAVFSVATAIFLLRQAGWARWLVLIGALLGVAQGVVLFALSGHWLAVVVSLPSVCILGAFHLETPRLRLAACVVGVLLAFSWFPLADSATGADGSDPMDPFLLPGGTFSDPVAGLSVVAPPQIALYDLQRMRDELGGRKSGVLGLMAKEGVSLEGAGRRVLARGPKDDVMALVSVSSLPPQMPSESLLPGLLGSQTRTDRVDELVPRSLRTSGLSTQAWRDPTRQVLLLRAPDGRMATVVCHVQQKASERLCSEIFAGVSLALGKRPRGDEPGPASQLAQPQQP
ncbi:MAG: hypothetical protein QM765_42490 [Myxococcales bacterium]